jgi:branched-chain amino acid transport system substrate-binding protein
MGGLVKSKKSWASWTVPGALLAGLTTTCGFTGTAASAASTKAPIVVGGVYQAADFTGLANGFSARIAQFNKAGGLDGRQIKFVGVQDDGSSPTTDLQIVQKLVQEDRVDVVLAQSDVFSPTSSTFLTQNKTPFIGWGISPNWCNVSYAFSIDGCLLPSNGEHSLSDGGVLVDYLKKIGKKASGSTVALPGLDLPTASATSSTLASLFGVTGFKVVFNKGILPANGTTTNFTPYVEQVLASNPDSIYEAMDFATSVGFSGALTAAGYKGVIYNPDGYSEGLLQAEPSVRGALQGVVVDSEFPVAENNTPATKAISAALKATGDTEPLGLGAVIGYYSADTLIQMLDNAAKKGKPLTGAGITAAANSGFTYKVSQKGGACAETYPAAHAAGIVGSTLLQVEGTQYKQKVPYTCFKNVKASPGS